MKILVCVSVLLITMGNCNSPGASEGWTPSKKSKMITIIINSSTWLKSTDSARAYGFANCSLEKLISLYTYEEMMNFDNDTTLGKDSMLKKIQFITEECFHPYKEIIIEEQKIEDCIKAATKSGRITTEQASKYCKCMINYINSRYTAEQLRNFDSILNLERAQVVECLNNPLK